MLLSWCCIILQLALSLRPSSCSSGIMYLTYACGVGTDQVHLRFAYASAVLCHAGSTSSSHCYSTSSLCNDAHTTLCLYILVCCEQDIYNHHRGSSQ
jgi:hypothetical protein